MATAVGGTPYLVNEASPQNIDSDPTVKGGSPSDLDTFVLGAVDSDKEMVRRFKRKIATQEVDLTERARILAKRYSLHTPNDIEWAENLTSVWGLCTPSTKSIRLSTRLVGFPSWVLDYVIVHELAHLHVSGHGPDFWEITRRYEKTERAIGYLIAKAGDNETDLD